VLITGGNGFIGKNLTNTLLLHNEKFEVYLLLRGESLMDSCHKNTHFVDFNNLDELQMVVRNISPNIVIHLAYSKDRDKKSIIMNEDYFLNLRISSHIIEAARNLPFLDKFIFLGSCDEYGLQSKPYVETQSERPLTSYGLSKLAITKNLIALNINEGFPSIVIRPSVVYGEGQGVEMFLPSLACAIENKCYFDMTKGKQYRDFIYIDDLIDAILFTLESSLIKTGEIINVSYGESYPLESIAKKLANMIRPKGELFLNIGAKNYRESEVMNYYVLNGKAKTALHWSPKISLEKGMDKILHSLERKSFG